MKTISLAVLFCLITFCTVTAQTNKPEPGAWGIGYQITFSDFTTQQFKVSRILNGGWETGTHIGFQYFHSQNTTDDSAEVFNGTTVIPAMSSGKSTFSNFTFSIAPFIVKHCSVSNNLDFYAGPIMHINISAKPTTVTSTEVTAEDYLSINETKTKNAAYNGIGIGGLAGCRYFFYTNLAIGAEYSLSAIYNFQKGETITETTLTNSGSNNPETGTNFSGFETYQINNSTLNIGAQSNIGLNLTFYF